MTPACGRGAASRNSAVRRAGVEMSVGKILEITASSPKRFAEAIQEGIDHANKYKENHKVKGVWIKGHKCLVEDGKITEYRVFTKVTFVKA